MYMCSLSVQDPVQSKGQVTDVVTTTAGNATPTGGDTVTYRTSPKKLSTRSHSATVGVYDQGTADMCILIENLNKISSCIRYMLLVLYL